MRFHHSTRRGRHHSAPSGSHGHHSSSTRWQQLNHCRETNIYFNRRLPVEYPNSQKQTVEPPLLTAANSLPLPLAFDATAGRQPPAQRTIDMMVVDQQQQQQPLISKKKPVVGEEPEEPNLEGLREKLIAQVQKHPFWSNKAAKRMQIKQVKRRNVYIYELESYCERRDLEWNFEPYRGGPSTATAHLISPYKAGTTIDPLLMRLPSASGSLSQPTTPLNHATSYIDAAGSSSGSGFHWSAASSSSAATGEGSSSAAATPTKHQQQSQLQSPTLRSLSNQSHLPASSSGSRYHHQLVSAPISARLEHLIPSADYVWSIDASMGHQINGHGSRRRPHQSGAGATGSGLPGCVARELPHSSFVKRCHGCQGRGKLKCNSCHGVGYEVCLSCSGKGTTRSYSSSYASGRSSGSGARGGDRSSANGYDRGDDDHYASPFGNSSGSGADANSRNSRYANGAGDKDSSGFGGSLGGWFTESCSTCHGAGQKRCWVCAGKSYNNCPGCLGTGNLRCYLTLTVSWLSHCDDVIINNSDQIIPKERLRVCSGLLLVDQVEDRLTPLQPISAAEVCGSPPCLQPAAATAAATAAAAAAQHKPAHHHQQAGSGSANQQHNEESCRDEAEQLHLASKHLLERHRHTYRGEKFMKQRHKVTQIECRIVKYEWKQRHGQFVIYGEERKVYIGKYPFKSFCNLI